MSAITQTTNSGAYSPMIISFNSSDSTSSATDAIVLTGNGAWSNYTANTYANYSSLDMGTATSFNDTVYVRNDRVYVVTSHGTNVQFLVRSEEARKLGLRQRLREQMQPDLTELFGKQPRALRDGADFRNTKQNEMLALQLLRSMVPSDVFRKYLKYGFVTVRGPSGLVYQIQRKSHFIKVWQQGQLLAELCVYLQDNTIPPTDEVIAKMIIAECDEPDIWNRANVYSREVDVCQHDVVRQLRAVA